VKSSRLLSILLLLQTRGRVPASELARRLEVSVRTIYRDVEALSSVGVPIYAERGRNGGIALLAGYRTDVTGLTRDEAQALFVLAASGPHADLGLGEALGSALHKVMAALPEPHRPVAAVTSQRITIDPARWMRTPDQVDHLDVVRSAVFTDRRLRLGYRHSGRPEPRNYTVDPYGLAHKGGVWYLVADHRRRPRLFRVSRVVTAALMDAPVRRRPGVEFADLWELLRQRVERLAADVRVRVRVRRRILDAFERVMGNTMTGPPEAGDGAADWAEAELRLRAIGEGRRLIGFGGDVEVLSPAAVRADIAQVAASVVELYGPPERPQ
jgi:predicted DNA-binding transcriptional regulator YafY